ncbi:Wzz/FepE/Etk N-terminal domain-containing protein [Bradyrhizobium tropiciagri]|uniref:Wzz/FepE/Etk N-terminal domain-containing protein n=1 Tax=Bradyrhizobium tropiciagri TaxID=312253 RepID=UPI000A6BD147|nr:Wzz/FepE/Etk N-terminal domain-containing protein [Bradyrhizobium tropiciagri]
MLQNTTENWVNRDNLPPPEFRPTPVISLPAVVAFIRRRLLTIFLVCCATLGVAILYLIMAVPTFTAKAQLIVDSKATPGDVAAVATIVESQIGIIRSESIASAVIEKLGLAEDPEFAGGQGSSTLSVSRLLGWTRPQGAAGAMRYAVESFGQRLTAKRVGPTYLVELTFSSKDPDRAAQILNAVAEKYITHQMDQGGSLQDETWVRDRLNGLSTQASAAQRALEEFGRDKKDALDSAARMDKLAAAAESSKSAYDSFRHMLRRLEATRQQSSPVFAASLITQALPPLRAASPKPKNVLGIAIVGGLLLGLAIAVLLDLLNGRMRFAAWDLLTGHDDGIERSVSDAVRPELQSDASTKTRPVRLTGSG